MQAIENALTQLADLVTGDAGRGAQNLFGIRYDDLHVVEFFFAVAGKSDTSDIGHLIAYVGKTGRRRPAAPARSRYQISCANQCKTGAAGRIIRFSDAIATAAARQFQMA